MLLFLLAPGALGHVPGSEEPGTEPTPPTEDEEGNPYEDLPWWDSWEDGHWYGTVAEMYASTNAIRHMRASGDWVVWEEEGDVKALHEPTLTVLDLTHDVAKQTRPAIEGNRVVWEQWNVTHTDIWEFDLDTGKARVVAASPWNERSPEVRGDWVIWYDDRSGDWEIWAMNLVTRAQVGVALSDVQKKDLVLFGDGIVAWREIEYNQWDIYVKRLPDGPVRALTRDRVLEHPPMTDGEALYWVKVPAGAPENALHKWDPATGEITILGKKGVTTNPIAFLPGGVEVTYTSHGPGYNVFLAVNRSADRLVPLSMSFPASEPVATDRYLYLVGTNESHDAILRTTASPYAVQKTPEMRVARPLDGSVILGPILANGTYVPRGAWPEPIRFEWRAGGPGFRGEWQTFEPRQDWTARIDVGNLSSGQAFRLHVRAVFDGAPPVEANIGLTFRTSTSRPAVDLDETPDLSIATFVTRNPGVVLLLLLVVVTLLLWVLRWRLRHVPRGTPRVEYVRQDD